MQALNALAKMRWESAMPILRDVIANKDSSRVRLRRRALMILAQKRGEGREDIPLDPGLRADLSLIDDERWMRAWMTLWWLD